MNMTTKTELMTPKRAAKIIADLDAAIESGKVKQRNRGQAWIRALCNLILLGRWKLIPDGIAFDQDGNLINGQHRLCAIIMAGVAVEIRVTYNADKESILAIDRGRVRGVGSQLQILGYDNGNLIAAIANSVVALVSPYTTYPSLEAGQAMDIHAQYERVFDELLACTLSGPQRERRAPFLAPMIIAATAQPVEVFEFARKYVSGEGLLKGDPALALRVWERNNSNMIGGRDNRLNCIRTVSNALKGHLTNKKIINLGASEEARQWVLGLNTKVVRRISEVVYPPKHTEPLKLAA